MPTRTEKTAVSLMVVVIIGIFLFFCVALWGAVRECRDERYINRAGTVMEGQELADHKQRMRKHGEPENGRTNLTAGEHDR
jgi:hypothetical protein